MKFKVNDLVTIPQGVNPIIDELGLFKKEIYKIESDHAFFLTHREVAKVQIKHLQSVTFPYINFHQDCGTVIVDSRLTNELNVYDVVHDIKDKHAYEILWNVETQLFNVKWTRGTKGKNYTVQQLINLGNK